MINILMLKDHGENIGLYFYISIEIFTEADYENFTMLASNLEKNRR